VLDTCAGLAALHGAKLVHRDIKPANVWLRLPLGHGEVFSPEKHRNPQEMRPLSAVVIDFGMVRPMRVAEEASGRFVAGTPGYIAPDQVLDPVELDGRADVYSLAGTIYHVTTGRTFFDEIKSPRDRIFAHMQRDPLEDATLLGGYPAALVRLMRAAVAQRPQDRPYPMEFARAFEDGL
jgi:eukaryotic-like serine/threonine-protein kinase